MKLRRALVLLIGIFGLGCGENSATCEVAEQACERACDCADGARCLITYGEGEVLSVYASFEECAEANSSTCGLISTNTEALCLDALSTAACVDFDGEMALLYPVDSCKDEE